MTVWVTGAAGFIGSHVSLKLLGEGRKVVGIDNLNAYYDPKLKEARLERLRPHSAFSFEKIDVSDKDAVLGLAEKYPETTEIIHLAAQAGVRHSLKDPYSYIDANVSGQLNILEACRRLPDLKHLAYASSSSVYGANKKIPFSVKDPVNRPVSLYAATKRSGELMAETYSHLYGIPATGLRFFTVYGPWGRPDMAAYIFTKAIFEGREIEVFNYGRMRRDFTYIDDIVDGVCAAVKNPPAAGDEGPAHRIYNFGNHRCEELSHFIEVIEKACGKAAKKDLQPIQPGDVEQTYADIEESTRDLGFLPKTPIEEGLPRFVAWFREYHGYGE